MAYSLQCSSSIDKFIHGVWVRAGAYFSKYWEWISERKVRPLIGNITHKNCYPNMWIPLSIIALDKAILQARLPQWICLLNKNLLWNTWQKPEAYPQISATYFTLLFWVCYEFSTPSPGLIHFLPTQHVLCAEYASIRNVTFSPRNIDLKAAAERISAP